MATLGAQTPTAELDRLSRNRRKNIYAVIRLSFDDRDDLSFSDDVVEFDQDSLDSSCRRRRDRNFHLHGFDESNLVAVADIAAGCDRKCTHATGDFGDDLDVWHFPSSGGPSDGLMSSRTA